jgi:hypothetical protein
MTLNELTELASRYGLIRVKDEGPYWNNTVFLWDELNNDETDGWVIKYDNWNKSMRICTKLEVCDGGYGSSIRIRPWESLEVELRRKNVEQIETILCKLQQSMPEKKKELKRLLNKKMLKEISQDFK